MKNILSVCLFLLLCIPAICSGAPNNTFDSLLRAARAVSGDRNQLQQLKLLESRLNEASPPQVIALDEAFLAIYTRLKDDSNIVATHTNLGVELTDAGRFDQAHTHFIQGLQLADHMQYYAGQVALYAGIGFLYKCIGEVTHDTKDFEQSMTYYNQAKSLSEKHKIDKYATRILDHMAQLYDLRKEPEKAIALYKQVIVLNRKAGNLHPLAINHINMGISLKNNRQYEASLQAYHDARVLLDSLKPNAVAEVILNNNLAILYHEMGNDTASEALALRVINDAAVIGMKPAQVDMMGLLSRIYEAQRKYPQALAYTRNMMLLKDTLLNKEKAGQIADMQSKYESIEKDERIVAQTEALSSGQKQNRNLWLIIGVLTIAGVIIYIIHRRTIRLNERIVQQHTELQEQKKELQQTNEIKDRLFSVISHDLRIPVNSLTSFTVLIDNTELTQEKLIQYTNVLKQTLGDTAALLENLLHFASTQMKSSRAMLQEVNTTETVEEVIQLLQPAIERKNIQVINGMPPDTVAFADPNMLSLIFRNLLSNAIKFSHKGATVHFSAAWKDGQLSCMVKDEGIGMDPELVRVFNDPESDITLTYQSTSGTQQEKGTGLGLMLCKTFAGLMHGAIRVTSKQGEGTSFFLTLPLAAS